MSLTGDGEIRAQAAENREKLRECAKFSFWAEIDQVHGDAIVSAAGRPEVDGEELVPADGLYTFDKDVGIVILTGDCQPILIARADGGAVAALHVGWRGNANHFPESAVRRLCREFSCPPRDLLAVRGPSLGPAASEFVNFDSEWPREFLPWFDRERRTMNLWELTRHQLRQAGLPPANIFSLDLCTKTMAGVFFSYRRKERERQASVIWREGG